jgi:hypothetical protein
MNGRRFPPPWSLPKSPRNGPVTFARQPSGIGPERNMPVTSVLLTVFEMSVAMAIGFVFGRIWQIRCDLEQQRAGGFTVPPTARIPHP